MKPFWNGVFPAITTQLTKDGALEISGTFTLGGNIYVVQKTLLVKSKEDAPKK